MKNLYQKKSKIKSIAKHHLERMSRRPPPKKREGTKPDMGEVFAVFRRGACGIQKTEIERKLYLPFLLYKYENSIFCGMWTSGWRQEVLDCYWDFWDLGFGISDQISDLSMQTFQKLFHT